MNTRYAGIILAAAIACAPGAASAQDTFPSRPIKITVGFPAGSSTDVATRVIANSLADTLGQSVVVENKPGASSDIAARQVAGAPADGYSLFVVTIANAINTSSKSASFIDVTRRLP
jgi:tripartite-type tricarboxylate transporter receptor subunit TctC